MAKQWEYLVIPLHEISDGKADSYTQQVELKELGKEGWELVAVIPTTGWDGKGIASPSKAYFKREHSA